MSGLKEVLQRTTEKNLRLGGAVSDSVIRSLGVYRTKLLFTFVTLFTVLICAVGFGAFGLAWFIKQPEQMAAFSGAMGLSVGGGIELMRRIWKEWSQAELLLILIGDAKEAQVIELIDKLIKKL